MLDTEGGALLRTALDAVMGPPAKEDDQRTPAQRRADALTDLARRQLDSGELPTVGGQRPHITLTADVATSSARARRSWKKSPQLSAAAGSPSSC